MKPDAIQRIQLSITFISFYTSETEIPNSLPWNFVYDPPNVAFSSPKVTKCGLVSQPIPQPGLVSGLARYNMCTNTSYRTLYTPFQPLCYMLLFMWCFRAALEAISEYISCIWFKCCFLFLPLPSSSSVSCPARRHSAPTIQPTSTSRTFKMFYLVSYLPCANYHRHRRQFSTLSSVFCQLLILAAIFCCQSNKDTAPNPWI